MLEITGDEIAQLNDTDLRSLIGLLCEAELASAQIPTAGVTWGGHQNAKDGGIDVRVDAKSLAENDGFVPRASTAFQVKKPDMPRRDILEEMQPKGELREVIKELVDNQGAYIIISSQGSTSDSALQNRKSAMKEAIQGHANASKLKIDFYDRERVASWVRSHPSMILWVREKIGHPLQGWQSFDNWADTFEDDNSEYFIDGTSRLSVSSRTDTNGMDLMQGIQVMRAKLMLPGSSVRLIGLSGVGKTRLIQALFDDRIGEGALDKSLAFYTDLGNGPLPDPKSFLIRIKSLEKRGILIVDNCPPDLHSQLTKLNASKSLISLITVEYDVREDQPELTTVFRLEPSSKKLLEKIISNKFHNINNITARKIADISGGNARVAIAIARTIKADENISHLRDTDLFNRLFRQRHDSDSKLLKVAEICSLVYSFNLDSDVTYNIEMILLAELAGVSALEFHRNVADLKRRDLVQQRDIWRAVLPHAIANRLAQNSLDNIPLSVLRDIFENRANKRLLISFSKRIGYLDLNPNASKISQIWLSDDGPLNDFRRLDNDALTMLRNIAPIQPELILSQMEKILDQDRDSTFFTRHNENFSYFTNLLKSLAYDAELFDRSVQLLCHFALSEDLKENKNSIRSTLKSLFQIRLSGTHATVQQRLKVISKLIESDSEKKIQLGLSLLDTTLEAWHFTSTNSFDFGSRVRDFGYQPVSSDQISSWYETFIQFAVLKSTVGELLATEIKAILSRKFRGIWTKAAAYSALENAVRDISTHGKWYEAWYAVKNTIKFDSDEMSSTHLAKLEELAVLLSPQNLYDEVNLLTLPGQWVSFNFTEDPLADIREVSFEVGKRIVSHENLNLLLIHLMSTHGRNIYEIGQGIAQGAKDPKQIWNAMTKNWESIEYSKRNHQLLQGFLVHLGSVDISLTHEILNEAMHHEFLSEIFPLLQIVVLDYEGIARLKESLQLGRAAINLYESLAYSRANVLTNEEVFCDLIRIISTKENGLRVAVFIYSMYIHPRNEELSPIFISLGQELVLKYDFNAESNDEHYHLSEIIKSCFHREESSAKAKKVILKLYTAIIDNHNYFSKFDYIVASLVEVHPHVFLDVFIGNNDDLDYSIERIFSDNLRGNPLSRIPHEVFIEWCISKRNECYPIIASVLKPYMYVEGQLVWTPVAIFLIDHYAEPCIILEKFAHVFHPYEWEGSLSSTMLQRLPLIERLINHENMVVSQWANDKKPMLLRKITLVREEEQNRERIQNERFE